MSHQAQTKVLGTVHAGKAVLDRTYSPRSGSAVAHKCQRLEISLRAASSSMLQIIGDNKQHGLPIIQNGLSLCKIHHAAFDANLLGISPEYVAHINRGLMNEIDGPMSGMASKRWAADF